MTRPREPELSIATGPIKAVGAIVSILWMMTGAVLGSRHHHLFGYDTVPTLPSHLELFGAPNSVLLALLASVGFALCYGLANIPRIGTIKTGADRNDQKGLSDSSRFLSCTYRSLAWGAASTLPLWLALIRTLAPETLFEPTILEVLWFALSTSLCVVWMTQLAPTSAVSIDSFFTRQVASGVMLIILSATTIWWYSQSWDYFHSFRLGFNDFAHFSQRVANTATGRGFLLETPVLPPFWDHFNPGLLLVVPFWKLVPSVKLIFWIQAISLSLPAWLLYSISLKKGESPFRSMCWGIAWLIQPSVSQMNLAYTYGWHPITMAVPFLLLSFRLLMGGRKIAALFSVLVAMSFEEGVIVLVGCFAAAMLARALWTKQQNDVFGIDLKPATWGVVWIGCVVAFGLVYAFSGLAPFQAGRFALLGDSLPEIILSPLHRYEFWALLLRPRNAIFLAILLLPTVIAGGWRSIWYLAAIALPLGVLLVWEHIPAQSIAFQYTSCLLPILALAGMAVSSSDSKRGGQTPISDQPTLPQHAPASHTGNPLAAIAAGWVLSIYLGQLPWSQSTLGDVLAQTYLTDMTLQRLPGDPDHQWISEQIDTVLKSASRGELRILATGRIAAHFVGASDVETVGQFLQRRNALSKLDPSIASPLLRYDYLLIDYQESFQQSNEDSQRVAEEALAVGFTLVSRNFNFELYRR